MPASLERARLLLEHERFSQAEREARGYLAEHPEDPAGHYVLAFCLLAQDRYDDATAEAKLVVHLAPDEPHGHYALAKVMFARRRLDIALAVIGEAIRLDPYDADYRASLAAIHLERRQWQPALDAADEGLAIYAEHAGCLNLRAMALVNLGRREEAGQTISTSLQKNPHNAVTHANEGWRLLHAGQPKQAMHHFRESLRLDPESGWAKAGILEAIKARNPLYRWLLAYFLWMGRLSTGAQWGVMIGLYFGAKIVRTVAENSPELAPFLWPLLGLYIAFALMTWLAYPLFNLLLRLHPLGKHALSSDQRWGANLVGGCWAGAIALGIVALITHWPSAIIAAITLAAVSLPAASIFQCDRGYPRNTMAGITFALLAIGLAAASVVIVAEDAAWAMIAVVALGVMASSWIANALASVQVKK